MSDEYACSGFQGSLVNSCEWGAHIHQAWINKSLTAFRSNQRYPPSARERDLSAIIGLCHEELSSARRQYVSYLFSTPGSLVLTLFAPLSLFSDFVRW
jgi:hypothetical protein